MSFFEEPRKPRNVLWAISTWFLGAGLVAGVLFVSVAPTPYLVEQPGPVYDLLSPNSDDPIISITGKQTYETQGSLDMLTVTLQGTAERGASWFYVGLAKLDQTKSILKITDIYPPGTNDEQLNEEADVMMLDSQANAKAAALNLLDIPYDSYQAVTLVDLKGAAGKILKAGDQVLKIQGVDVIDIYQIKALVEETKGKKPVVLEILRGKKQMTVSITPKKVDGSWRMGVYISEVPVFPFEIEINVGNVGGPSAGQMLALAIYDKLTPGSLTGGEKIAGTGTVDPDGNIGAIGGIVQKMWGASGAGAKWFLAPSENCSEVLGKIPEGISVIKVSNLQDSLAALKVISQNGNTASLPTCTK